MKKLFPFFLIIIFIIPVWPEFLELFYIEGLPTMGPVRLFLSIFILLALLSSLSHKSSAERWNFKSITRERPFRIYVIFYFYAFLTTILFASKLQRAMLTIINELLVFVILSLFVACYFREKKRANSIIKVLFMAFLVSQLYGIYEYFDQFNYINSVIPRTNDYIEVMLGTIGSGGRDREGVHRVSSIYASALSYAEALAFFMTFAYFSKAWLKDNFSKILRIIILCITPFAVYTTDSRAGQMLVVFNLFAIIALELYFRKKLTLKLIAFVFFVVFSAGIYVLTSTEIPQKIIEKLFIGTTETASSSLIRVVQFFTAVDLVSKNPLGYGYVEAVEISGLRSIDNYYFNLVIDTGIVGLLLFVSYYYLITIGSLKMVLNKDLPVGMRRFAAGLTLSFFTLLIFMLILSLRGTALIVMHILIGMYYCLARQQMDIKRAQLKENNLEVK